MAAQPVRDAILGRLRNVDGLLQVAGAAVLVDHHGQAGRCDGHPGVLAHRRPPRSAEMRRQRFGGQRDGEPEGQVHFHVVPLRLGNHLDVQPIGAQRDHGHAPQEHEAEAHARLDAPAAQDPGQQQNARDQGRRQHAFRTGGLPAHQLGRVGADGADGGWRGPGHRQGIGIASHGGRTQPAWNRAEAARAVPPGQQVAAHGDRQREGADPVAQHHAGKRQGGCQIVERTPLFER